MRRVGEDRARFRDDGGSTVVFHPADDPSVRAVENRMCTGCLPRAGAWGVSQSPSGCPVVSYRTPSSCSWKALSTTSGTVSTTSLNVVVEV